MDGKWEMEKKGKVSFGLGCGLEASLSATGLCFLGKLLYFFLDFPTFPLAPPRPRCCGSVFHDVCTFAPCTASILSYKAKISAIWARQRKS